MAEVLVRECLRVNALLHSYEVMPNHIHMLVRLPPHMTPSDFMRSFKPRTGFKIRKLLSSDELAEFSDQSGLNGNAFGNARSEGY